MRRPPDKQQGGATLLEVVAALVIMGMVATGTLAILSNLIQGMLQTRNDTASAENIQAALTRITHEIVTIDTKRSYTFASTSITYYHGNAAGTSTIQLSGSNLQLNGYTLLGNVTAFTVTAPNYGTSPAVPVGISITVNVPKVTGNQSKTYAMQVELNTQRFQ